MILGIDVAFLLFFFFYLWTSAGYIWDITIPIPGALSDSAAAATLDEIVILMNMRKNKGGNIQKEIDSSSTVYLSHPIQ
jgi:hypothetical protein